jgi:hypothetical protein
VTHHTQQYGSSVASGLVGAVGREATEKALLDEGKSASKRRGNVKGRRKDRHGRHVLEVGDDGVWSGLGDSAVKHVESEEKGGPSHIQNQTEASDPTEIVPEADALRSAIGTWPRIVYPPMKRSGHVILDTCTSEGMQLSARS